MRELVRLPVPPGAAGAAALLDALPRALDGSGPAIAPVPTTSVTVATGYVQRILDATLPDEPLERDDVAMVVATSGSTGRPRGVLHSARSLTAIDDAIIGGAHPTWVVAIPVTAAGGLNVLLRSLAAGREPVALASIGGAVPFTPALFADGVDTALASGSDVRTSLVAAQVRRLLDDPRGVEALRACTTVLVGGGPLDAVTRDRATDHGIALTATYGATETAGGCVYDGHPLPGVGMAIDPATGEILLTGPMLALGYRLNPEATALRFTSAGYRTGDLGEIRDGRLVVTGRIDDLVMVRGTSVSLLAVEALVREQPGIADAGVAATQVGGEPAIVAFVTLRPGVDAAAVIGAVQGAVADELGRAAVPRVIEPVETVPALPNGKPDRVALRAAAADLLGA